MSEAHRLLDGNAIAGELFDYFGQEMTVAPGSCAHCGAVAVIAELRVYRAGPGAVVRCRSCDEIVMVLVEIHGVARVDMDGFTLAGAGTADS